MFGMNTCDAYSKKVFAFSGASMLTIAAPSKTITSTGGVVEGLSSGGGDKIFQACNQIGLCSESDLGHMG